MKTRTTIWDRLVVAARMAPVETRDVSAPAGFATRVAALGLARVEPTFEALFARFALRALGACAAVMVLGVALNFGPVLNAVENEAVAVSDPVAEWLNAAS